MLILILMLGGIGMAIIGLTLHFIFDKKFNKDHFMLVYYLGVAMLITGGIIFMLENA